MTRGPFLSLDGLDGTGKSTQCRLLAQWLRGRGSDVIECAEPGGTVIGDRLRELLLHLHLGDQQMVPMCEMFMFMASRAQLVEEIIRPALEAGKAVVCDRYLLASVVYQGHAGGLPVQQLWEIGRIATKGIEPDLTLVLDLPPEETFDHGRAADRMESRGKAFQAKVRRGFLEEAAGRPDRIKVIQAHQPIQVVQQQICQEVTRVVAASPRT